MLITPVSIYLTAFATPITLSGQTSTQSVLSIHRELQIGSTEIFYSTASAESSYQESAKILLQIELLNS